MVEWVEKALFAALDADAACILAQSDQPLRAAVARAPTNVRDRRREGALPLRHCRAARTLRVNECARHVALCPQRHVDPPRPLQLSQLDEGLTACLCQAAQVQADDLCMSGNV